MTLCTVSCGCARLCRTFVSNMVRAVAHGNGEASFAMLWLLAYAFLLRLPSEARGVFIARRPLVCVSACAGPARLQRKARYGGAGREANFGLERGRHGLSKDTEAQEPAEWKRYLAQSLLLQGLCRRA